MARKHSFRVASTLVILAGLSATNSTFSSQLREQPFHGFVWPTQEISVVVQRSPEYARKAVLDSMSIWNLAQIWFSNFSRISSRPYRFVEIDEPRQSCVKVFFNETQTRDDWGYTLFPDFNYSDVLYRGVVLISLDLALSSGKSLGPIQLKALAAHEFGHALGLAHITFSEKDLMNHFSPNYNITVPSTLNLYALAILSTVTSRSNMPASVTLPESIPYMIPSESIIPEMQYPAMSLFLSLAIVILMLRGRRSSSRRVARAFFQSSQLIR